MKKTESPPKFERFGKIWGQKQRVTRQYVEWFIENQSGERVLAKKLSQQWVDGWNLILSLFRKGYSSEEVTKQLKTQGYNAMLLEKGVKEYQLPGRTVSFLLLDREKGCKQITLERWTATSSETTNIILIGMGQKDISLMKIPEKQIHLSAFELPKAGDYLEITTQSLSPIIKGVIVFVGALLTTGCGESSTPPPKPECCVTTFDVPANRSGCKEVPWRIGWRILPGGEMEPIMGKRAGEEFDMIAKFSNTSPCECNCCEYRQFVRGSIRTRLPGRQLETQTHMLTDGPLDPNVWKEDSVPNGRGPGMPGRYGHRSDGNYPGNTYENNGCSYRGHDFPHIQGKEGTEYDIDLQFKGQIIDTCNGNAVKRENTWSVRCSGVL
jgi:hypothetical protein